jgi:AhpC/TSA family.
MVLPRQSRTNQTRRLALCAALSALIVVCTMVGYAYTRLPQKSTAENLDGKPLDPFAASANRVVALLFVRTDCPISNRYAPLLQKMSEKFRGRADFWLVYPDRGETASQIKAHLQAYHYSIAAVRDTDHALVRRAQATITPEAAVFDSSGRLLYHGRIDNWYEDFGRSRPAATSHELDDAISSAIAGKPIHPDHANAVGCYISDLT